MGRAALSLMLALAGCGGDSFGSGRSNGGGEEAEDDGDRAGGGDGNGDASESEAEAEAEAEADPGPIETACDGLDDDADGLVDDGCACVEGRQQPCWPGPAAARNVGACRDGAQTCAGNAEFAAWGACEGAVLPVEEACGDGLDDDCAGDGENSCPIIDVQVEVNDDCVWVSCPDTHPYPVGCELNFVGGDPRGCVAFAAGDTSVYLQEGDNCGAGHVEGTLTCSTEPGGDLTAENCDINKPDELYVDDPGDCPEEDCGFFCLSPPP